MKKQIPATRSLTVMDPRFREVVLQIKKDLISATKSGRGFDPETSDPVNQSVHTSNEVRPTDAVDQVGSSG